MHSRPEPHPSAAVRAASHEPALPATAAAPCFEQALIRQGRARHEWFQLDRDGHPDFELRQARMVVTPERCQVATDDVPVEVDLLVTRGREPAVLDMLYRLPEGSWLMVDDAWENPLLDGLVEEDEFRVRMELPEGRVRINARLAAGGRLSVRIATTGR